MNISVNALAHRLRFGLQSLPERTIQLRMIATECFTSLSLLCFWMVFMVILSYVGWCEAYGVFISMWNWSFAVSDRNARHIGCFITHWGVEQALGMHSYPVCIVVRIIDDYFVNFWELPRAEVFIITEHLFVIMNWWLSLYWFLVHFEFFLVLLWSINRNTQKHRFLAKSILPIAML